MREYTVIINDIAHTVLLDAETAERYGATPVASKAAPTPANKARTAVQNKSGGR